MSEDCVFSRTREDEGSDWDRAAADGTTAVVPIILAGGAGTRLWPMSRELYPKQLIDLFGGDSLLQATARRMDGFCAEAAHLCKPLVVCSEEQRFVTVEQLQAKNIEAELILEPVRRNTAPALTLAAAFVDARTDDAVLVAMPADHVIEDIAALHHALAVAVGAARNGAIVALGVRPTRPDTAYGYILTGSLREDGTSGIVRFVEKPAPDLAAQYVASSAYWWNSGIVVVRATVWLDAVKTLESEMHEACVSAITHASAAGLATRASAEWFERSPSDSIDYAVMEHLGADPALPPGVMVPLEGGWSDVGSWNAVWEAFDKDPSGNVARGRVVFEAARSTFALSEGRLVACVGVTGLVVIDTDDAVLVVDRSHVQHVKGLVDSLKARRAPEADTHRKVRCPWGYYDLIDRGEHFLVKRLVVKPGEQLSLQLHHHRSERWVVVRGTARVVRGDEQFLLSEGQSTDIPLGARHRLENPGKLPLEVIEVQSGSYLGEDDIVRFDDLYGRT
ncbi:mannose-1-phosphate guanylyltransferase/mannose-6-phosphate isomerase [Burkholderia sp. BDU5]|uniref:mannose-1-phosphate guanylyltransferase/mannose-6-phosphate isomerase n=1 Tax=Burkholderia sp. BDU5 TaxID=1385590 RepID=UPI00075E7746|nr:mannose-1-phosphate guanylyltransferase/mannose-6-phosphate isomerase [Burkholderia sp. BDU5]KVE36830.1 mannose-1-phosphate guanyltransferase [Burkholderia sp. BDU5]